MYLGLDTSLSSTGICILDENKQILLATTIPTSNNIVEMNKLYPLYFTDIMSHLNATGLFNKKKKDYTKEDKELLKIDSNIRIQIIADELDKILKTHHVHKAGLESISFMSKGRIADLARLLGAIERTLYLNEVEYEFYTPLSIKKYAGVKDFKNKNVMYDILSDEIKFYINSLNIRKIDDIVDSYHIAKKVSD